MGEAMAAARATLPCSTVLGVFLTVFIHGGGGIVVVAVLVGFNL